MVGKQSHCTVIFKRILDILNIGTEAFRGAHFGQGSGPIFLESFNCNGSESDLLSCSSGVIGIHTCDHTHDAGVRCIGNHNYYFNTYSYLHLEHSIDKRCQGSKFAFQSSLHNHSTCIASTIFFFVRLQ